MTGLRTCTDRRCLYLLRLPWAFALEVFEALPLVFVVLTVEDFGEKPPDFVVFAVEDFGAVPPVFVVLTVEVFETEVDRLEPFRASDLACFESCLRLLFLSLLEDMTQVDNQKQYEYAYCSASK